MMTANPVLALGRIPIIWHFRMVLHGVRLSRCAHDGLTTICGDVRVTYRVTMVDGHLVGAESAPLEVRVNIRAASFVLRAFDQQSAQICADSGGALFAIQLPSSAHESL